MAGKVGDFMKEQGVQFIQGFTPEAIKELEDGKKAVRWGTNKEERFDTVLYAIGRTPQVEGLNLEAVGV